MDISSISESREGLWPNKFRREARLGKRTLSSLALPIMDSGLSWSLSILNRADSLGMIRLVRKSSGGGRALERSRSGVLGGSSSSFLVVVVVVLLMLPLLLLLLFVLLLLLLVLLSFLEEMALMMVVVDALSAWTTSSLAFSFLCRRKRFMMASEDGILTVS